MTIRYHVPVDRQGDQWRAVFPALRDQGGVTGDETREDLDDRWVIDNVAAVV